MGAPAVIAVPSKSYVAINSYTSARLRPPTLCDLGRVSNIAAAVTLPRTTNFVTNDTRNNIGLSTRSLSYKKRHISEVSNCSSSTSYYEHAPTASSNTDTTAFHKRRRYTSGNQPSISSLVAPYIMETNLDGSHDSNPKAKEIELRTIETSRIVSSPNESSYVNHNNNSMSFTQNIQRKQNTQAQTSKSTNSSPRVSCLKPVKIRTQATEPHPHQHMNQQARLHAPNTTRLPNQQSVQLPTPGMEHLPTQPSL